MARNRAGRRKVYPKEVTRWFKTTTGFTSKSKTRQANLDDKIYQRKEVQMGEAIKIVLILDGGLVQDILISSGKVEAYVIDYDIEGAEAEDIMTVTFSASEGEPNREQACVSHWDKLGNDPKFIYQLEKDFSEHEKRRNQEEGI
jgi:hypothetical protein